ncbi:acid protease [Atractiella rhizophila]|nr:acid protease [Atractiella rhizophila]
MGMGFQTIANSGKPSFVENLIASNRLKQNLTAFYLTRGEENGSMLSIGQVDESKYTGRIAYTDVTRKGYWQVAAQEPVVGGKSVGSSYPAAIDTGTTLIYLPKAVAKAIYDAIPGATLDKTDSASGGADIYQFPCAASSPALPTIALAFEGITQALEVDSRDFNLGLSGESKTGDELCVGGIFGMDFKTQDGNMAIVGDEFLKSWYSVYDYGDGATARVGFARSKNE